MRSDAIKTGIERAPHRAALYAVGCSKDDLKKPFIGVVNSASEIFLLPPFLGYKTRNVLICLCE